MKMKANAKISREDRRAAIIKAAQRIFVEKGFYKTTTRELAEAAGISEALLFKHFPSKEALYSAIQMACIDEEGLKIGEWLQSLTPSSSTLVLLVHDLISHVLGGRKDEGERTFFHLILRSLMDEGEFARLAIQGGPAHWVRKVEECIKAAKAAGDLIEEPVKADVGGWFAHQLITGIMVHMLSSERVIDYGISHKELVKQATWFCLRGMGMKEIAIRRFYRTKGNYKNGAKDSLTQ
jgi:AcrR family transcriptional regulator